jgi:protein-disulfide isomerase
VKKISQLLVALLLVVAGNAGAEMTLFRYQGIDYSSDDLNPALQQSLYEAQLQYYHSLREIAGEAALQLHVQEGGEAVAKSLEAPAPDEATLKKFYDDNQARIGQPYEQIRDQLASFLQSRDREQRRSVMLGELQSKRQFALLMRMPVPPQMSFDTTGYPYKGGDEAKVTIVEFADYQCPHCLRAKPVLSEVLAEYGDRVRFVYLDFPVNRSGISRVVAHGAICANEQDRYWDYHDTAFQQQAGLSEQSPRAIATALELDLDTFDACMQSERPSARVQAAQAQGERAGVSGTPTIFVNGRQLHAENLGVDLRRAINAELDGDNS